jgi:transglutaminase-like putative cysteine protease/tetratricopeptide (TPR) repeat protein
MSLANAAEPAAGSSYFSLAPQALYSAASAPRAPEGTEVSILEFHETYVFNADGGHRYTQYFIYKILSPEGAANWNSLTVRWSPWLNDKPTMKARVIAADGAAYTLDPKTITDSPANGSDSTIYSDARTLRAPLPAIAPGAVVETEISFTEKLPFAGAGHIGRSWFQTSGPIQHVRLTLEAPTSIPLRHRVDLLPGVTPIHTEENGVSRWVFESGPMPVADDATPGLPSDVYSYPMVTFSTASSWQSVAQEYSKIIAARLTESNVRELVTRLTKGRATRDAKISAIMAYLNREIRYTGIEFDQASIVPHSTAEVLARKYGDCKDKSLLMVAMLRAAGIPANLALLNAGERLDIPADLPGMGLFDHAIVYVPGEPALWIDATDENARLGQMPDVDRGRSALIVDASTTGLTPVAEARSVDNVISEDREIRLADNGPARVTEVSQPTGDFESEYRRAYADLNDKETKENLTDYVKSEYLAERLEKLTRSDPKDFSQPFRLTLEGARAARGSTSLREAIAYIRMDSIFNNLPSELRTRERTDEENAKATRPTKKRVADYSMRRPFVTQWHYRVVPPQGFQPTALPANAKIALGPAELTQQFFADPDGSVRVDLRFDTLKRRFTPAEQSALRNKAAELIDGEAIKIKFDLKAHQLLAQGQARESFQAYRELVKQHPKDAIQHLRRADGLLEAGMGEAARAEAALAVKLDPKSAFAQETLAFVLQHDLIGRWHQAGADYAGAAAAYRAAIALDADDKTLVTKLAVLLEHDSRGMRYGPSADLKGAVAQYRTLTSSQLAELGMQNNLPFALFYARDFQAALDAANTGDAPPLGLIVACEAQLKGVAPALEQARRRANGDANYKQVVAVAGQLLMAIREYSNSAAMLEAGASGAAMARTMGVVAILRQAKRHEDLHFAETPEDFVRQVLVKILRSPSLEAYSEFESVNAGRDRASLTPDDREEVLQALRGPMEAAGRSGASLDVLIDLSLAAIQLKSSGDDSVGYREVMLTPNMPNQSFFVVKESGQYKLLDSAQKPVALALEVLDRVERGDLVGARTLLNWVREAKPKASTEDPYAADPYLRLWASQQQDATASAIKNAAAALLVQESRSARKGVDVLEQARATAGEAESENIELALLLGYENLRNHERALALAESLAKRTPSSQRAFYARSLHLRALNRFKEADELARQRLQKTPDDIDAMRVLAENAAAQHDYATAYENGLKIVANGSSGPSDMNQIAWFSLFYPRAGGPDVDTAVRAAGLVESSGAILHTLGCLYAEVGKTREAREVLLQAMTSRNLSEPNSDFWYAFGRIAEQYGENEIALNQYKKVTPPKDTALDYFSVYRLAQNRVQALKGAKGAAPAK